MGGSEVEIWQAWERGESRCPYCLGLDAFDWFAVCDCDMAPDPGPEQPHKKLPAVEVVEGLDGSIPAADDAPGAF